MEKLLEQLRDAGVEVSSADDPISDDDKMKLLESLRASHGKDKPEGPRKITMRRKSKTELRVSGGGTGRSTTQRSINVEVRKKRTYVKRSVVQDEEKQRLEEEAAQKAAEEAADAARQDIEVIYQSAGAMPAKVSNRSVRWQAEQSSVRRSR